MLANKAKFVDFITVILIFFYKIRHFPEFLHPFLFLASVSLLCLSDIPSTLSACNFQSMKSHVKLNSLFLKFFSYITCLITRDTGHLANEGFTSNPMVSSNQ